MGDCGRVEVSATSEWATALMANCGRVEASATSEWATVIMANCGRVEVSAKSGSSESTGSTSSIGSRNYSIVMGITGRPKASTSDFNGPVSEDGELLITW